MGEHLVGGMLSDVHFIIIEGMHREGIGRVRCMGVDGLIEMGG
jgi:hypothetical protein